MTRHHSCRVSPFGHPRIHARLTAPRGITQPPTSFIGSQCQGIHHAPLNTYTQNRSKNILGRIENCIINNRTQRIPLQMLATTIHKSNTTPHHQSRATTQSYLRFPTQGRRDSGLVVSKPNSVLAVPQSGVSHTTSNVCRAPTSGPLQVLALISQPQLIPQGCGGGGTKNGAP